MYLHLYIKVGYLCFIAILDVLFGKSNQSFVSDVKNL